MYGSAASIIIELVVVGLLVIGIAAGVKKGFFKSLMDLVILVAAIFAAIFACRFATDFFVNRFYPKAEEKVLKAIESAEVDLANVDLSTMKIDENHPDTLSDAEYALLKQNDGVAKLADTMGRAGISESRIRSIIAKTLKKAGSTGSGLSEALTDSAKAATRGTLTVIVQVILFLLVLVIVSILLQLLTNETRRLLWKIDILKTLDRFLGFLTGAVLMLAVILIAFFIFNRVQWDSFENAVGQTLFAKFLSENNPLSLFFE